MPRVGREEFPYTRKGIQDAKRYARRTGQPVRQSPRGRPGYGSVSPDRRPNVGPRRGPNVGPSRFAPPGRKASLLGSNRGSRRRKVPSFSRFNLPKKRYA